MNGSRMYDCIEHWLEAIATSYRATGKDVDTEKWDEDKDFTAYAEQWVIEREGSDV